MPRTKDSTSIESPRIRKVRAGTSLDGAPRKRTKTLPEGSTRRAYEPAQTREEAPVNYKPTKPELRKEYELVMGGKIFRGSLYHAWNRKDISYTGAEVEGIGRVVLGYCGYNKALSKIRRYIAQGLEGKANCESFDRAVKERTLDGMSVREAGTKSE